MNQTKEGLQQTFNHQYIVKKKLSSGSFGVVFLGFDKQTKEEVAIKVEKEENEDVKSLDREVLVLSRIQSVQGIPKLYWSGAEHGLNVLIIQLLGKDLAYHMKSLKKFSLRTTLQLARQLVALLQRIHQKGVIHRDLKPENILFGKDSDQSNIYLVDFGISKIFKDSNGKHIPYRENKPFIGTTRYASLAAHKGQELSRKDDLESLIYVLIFFLKGRLPWQNLNVSDKERTKAVGEMKIKYSLNELCKELPEFKNILEQQVIIILLLTSRYLRELTFTSEPNYRFVEQQIEQAAESNNIEFDNIYDWTEQSQTQFKKLASQESKLSLNNNKISHNDRQFAEKPPERKTTNQMLISIHDSHHYSVNQTNLLIPPDQSRFPGVSPQRQDSKHLTHSSMRSSGKATLNSLKMKYMPSFQQIDEDECEQLKDRNPQQNYQQNAGKHQEIKSNPKLERMISDTQEKQKEDMEEFINDKCLFEKYTNLQKKEKVRQQQQIILYISAFIAFQTFKSNSLVKI